MALQAIGPDAEDPSHHMVGLYHVAFRRLPLIFSPSMMSWQQGFLPAIDHGISWALYLMIPMAMA